MTATAKFFVTVLLLALIGAMGYTYAASHGYISGMATSTADTSSYPASIPSESQSASAYFASTTDSTATTTATTTAQAAATSTPDGDYYAYVTGFKLNGLTSVTLTLEPVTYFTGAEASTSAAHDVTCASGKLATCVPTLAQGYYVRESAQPQFSVAANLSTDVSLSTTTEAKLRANPTLQALGSYKPVVLVTVKDEQAASIKEVTKP